MNVYRDFVEFDGVGRANAPCRVLSLVGADARPEGFEDELQKFSTRWHSHSQVCFVKLCSSIDTASILISFSMIFLGGLAPLCGVRGNQQG